MDVGLRIVALLLALACFVSFLWALRSLFAIPGGKVPGRMKLLSVCGAVCFAMQVGFLILGPPNPMWGIRVLGVILYLASLALFWWSVPHARQLGLKIAFTKDVPSALHEDGPYRHIRHPFYASYLLFWLAGVFATGAPWLLLTVVVMGVFYWRAIQEEERAFDISPLSTKYAAYRARTGLMFPRFLRHRGSEMERS